MTSSRLRLRLKFTFSFRKFILGLQHSLGPEYLDPLVIPIVGEPGEIDRGDGPGGEGHGDLDVVVVIDRLDLRNEACGAGVDLRRVNVDTNFECFERLSMGILRVSM